MEVSPGLCYALHLLLYAPMLGGCSKKRKHGDRVFRFKTFCSPGNTMHFHGTFQENIRAMLEFGNHENDLNGEVKRWSFLLELHRHPPIQVSLYIMEEFINEKSNQNHCHYCRCIGWVLSMAARVNYPPYIDVWECQCAGWGHHMICNRLFHFVLLSRKAMPLKETHGISGYDPCGDVKAFLVMNLQSQLMHGIMHSNGFGHLLCVNGIEGGSEVVSGHQIVGLWDRICTSLQTRKVSLIDTARKGAMNLRLIHGVAYGEPWFGAWGYNFCPGSFGVTREMYHNSVEVLQSLPLCLLIPQYGSIRHEVPSIVAKYQMISGNSLLTLGHLLKFMHEIKRRLPLDTLMALDYHGIATEPACRWSMRRVEMAAQVIVDTLKKAGPRWVSRQDVRDSARTYVGDTGLLDFVLKSIGNHVVGSYMVRRMVNPVTKVLEYCLEDMGSKQDNPVPSTGGRIHLTRVQIMRDLLYLYKYVLKEQNPTIATGIFDTVPMAVKIILDSKQLIKDYCRDPIEPMDNNIRLVCSVHLRHEGRQTFLSPCCEELVSLPTHATIKDLKKEVENQFRKTYLGLASFAAESVVGINSNKESNLILSHMESGSRVVISGSIPVLPDMTSSSEMLEGGCGDYGNKCGSAMVVDCQCGVKEIDGERMICCDVCEAWQHTRCVQIPNSEDLPTVFLCRHCEQGISTIASLVP